MATGPPTPASLHQDLQELTKVVAQLASLQSQTLSASTQQATPLRFAFSEYKEPEGVDEYLKRFELQLDLCTVPLEKQSSYLRLHMGPMLNSALRSLAHPKEVEQLDFPTCKQLLVSHFVKSKSNISEAIQFRRIIQEQGESIAKFTARVREGARSCAFLDLDYALVVQFIHGVTRDDIRNEILSKKPTSFDSAVKIALDLEATHGAASSVKAPAQLQPPQQNQFIQETRPRSTGESPSNSLHRSDSRQRLKFEQPHHIAPPNSQPARTQSTLSRQLFLGMVMALPSVPCGISLAHSAVSLGSLDSTVDKASWSASASTMAYSVVSLLAGKLMNQYGRKPSLLSITVVSFIGWLLLSISSRDVSSSGLMMIGRILAGIAGGLASVRAVVYAAQRLCPNDAQLRSALTAGFTVGLSSGIFLLFLTGQFVVNDDIAAMGTLISLLALVLVAIFASVASKSVATPKEPNSSVSYRELDERLKRTKRTASGNQPLGTTEVRPAGRNPFGEFEEERPSANPFGNPFDVGAAASDGYDNKLNPFA